MATSKPAKRARAKLSRRSRVKAPKFIVGIGGSAGGLSAYKALLNALPPNTGMAFVIVTNILPTADRQLAQVLSWHTKMPVVAALAAMPIRANHVYVSPANADLLIEGHAFEISPARAKRDEQVDVFLTSLAEAMGARAVGIIFSGYGGDGTEGCKHIKARGGTTFAQDMSAEVGSMPLSAQKAGFIDFVLPPDKISVELQRLSGGLPLSRSKASVLAKSVSPARAPTKSTPAPGETSGQPVFDTAKFLAALGRTKSVQDMRRGALIFRQGEPADAVFYLDKGSVQLAVTSKTGKRAILAEVGGGDFFGEGCLAGQPLRMTTARAAVNSAVTVIPKAAMIRVLREHPDLSEVFTAYLLGRNIQFEAELVDQLFNSSEVRLARVLLLLANFAKEGGFETVIPKVTQETLAARVGTTRSRINHFMNKFRKLGYIEYNGTLKVHTSLLNVVANG